MADDFDPTQYGATHVNDDFDPLAHGASHVEENQPTSNAPSYNFDKLYPRIEPNWKSVPEMATFMAPELAVTGISKIPHIANALAKAAPWLKQRPIVNALLKTAKGSATSAAGSALTAPEGEREKATLQGGGLGALGSALSQALGLTNPLARAVLSGAAGAGVGGATAAMIPEIGVDPWKAASATGLATAGLSKYAGGLPAGYEVLKHITPQEVSNPLAAGKSLGYNLTPGEASGNPFVGGMEGRFASTGEAAAEKARIDAENIKKQANIIQNFKQSVSPSYIDSAHATREAAKDYIENLKGIRSKESGQLYKEAENVIIPQEKIYELLETPRIKKTFEDILNDPEYLHELTGAQPTGKKMLAATDHMIDQYLEKARSKPYNSEEIENLEYAKNNLKKNYQDPRVQSVLKDIYDNDPTLFAASKGIDLRSGKIIDLAKKIMNQASENFASGRNASGVDKYKASLINDSAKKLTDIADEYIEPYKQARTHFARLSPEIEQAEESMIGRIANTSDKDLKNISSIVFDPSQTNPHVMQKFKLAVMRKDPQAWDGLVRSEIERLAQNKANTGKNFFASVLSNEGRYKQLHLALDHNPDAQEMLKDMKTTFNNLANPPKPNAAAYRSQTGLDQPRGRFSELVDLYNKLTGAKRNVEALRFIHGGAWDEGFAKIQAHKNAAKRREATADLVGKLISGEIMTGNS